MTLCQEAHSETCRSVDALPGCDCDLCKSIAPGKWWYCIGCDCDPCVKARELERRMLATAVQHEDCSMTHIPRIDVIERSDGAAVVTCSDAKGIRWAQTVWRPEPVIDWDAVARGVA